MDQFDNNPEILDREVSAENNGNVQQTSNPQNLNQQAAIPQNPKQQDNSIASSVVYEEIPASANSTNRNNICKYFKIASVDGKQLWTCPAGHFCSTPDSPPVRCPRGFLCPENSQQPAYCCEGWYCETSSEARPCEKGKWCPLGSVKPKTCFGLGLSQCPERTIKAPKWGIIIVFVVFFVIVAILFGIKNKVRKIKYTKYNNLLQHFMDEKERPKAVSIDHKKFDIKFEKLGLVLPSKVEIMKDVSGEFKAGRTCAIMGPSGAGKTTFVNLLTEKVKRTSGTIYINGKKDSLKNYKKLIGFVPQEDVMLRELTVQDILLHSAKMRLPTSWTKEQKKSKVLEVIHFLELDHVVDSIIGNEEERGISGGQRKRVNIGMELVADPNILFLDEPTSGLDSSTSFEVCSLLSEIAIKQNMTIVAVIHSPSAEAFEQFDDILLLGKGGKTVFFGPITQAKEYFARIGFPCPENCNPADFFMDVTSGKVPCSLKSDFKPSDLFDFWNLYNDNNNDFNVIIHSASQLNKYKLKRLPTIRDIKVSSFSAFYEMFRDVFYYINDVLGEIWENVSSIFSRKPPVRKTPNLFTVFWLDFKRACLQLYRNLSSFFLDQVLHLGCGLFISIASQDFVYLPKQPNEVCTLAPPNLQKQCFEPTDQLAFTGIFLSIGVLFSGMSVGSSTFGNEKVVFWRDTSAGQPTISYYLAKVVADIPRIIVAAIMFTASFILFFPYNSSFILIYLVVLALYFCAFAMGYFLSTIFDKKIVALASTGFSLLWALVLSGVIPDIANFKDNFYAFIWNLSPSRWGIELFWLIEVNEFINDIVELPHTYSKNTMPIGFLYIICIALGWHVISYLCMKLLHRQKQK